MVVNADFFSGSKTRKLNSSENQLHFSLHKSHSFPHNGVKKKLEEELFSFWKDLMIFLVKTKGHKNKNAPSRISPHCFTTASSRFFHFFESPNM